MAKKWLRNTEKWLEQSNIFRRKAWFFSSLKYVTFLLQFFRDTLSIQCYIFQKFSLCFFLSEKWFSISQSSLIENAKSCDKICGAMALLTRLKKELAFH